ncbi:MAG: NYN domain-containing protein [Fimbriimonadaceae bacterium]
MALFLDAENFLFVATEKQRVVYFDTLLRLSREHGLLVLARAYADWSNKSMQSLMKDLHRHGIPMEQLCTSEKGKNTADMQLAADALELCLGETPPDVVVIVSGDRDMVPLVHKIKRRAISVIGIGLRTTTAVALSNTCTHFYFYEDLEVDPLAKDPCENSPADLTRDAVRELLVRAIDLIEETGRPLTASALNLKMKQLDPTFDHRVLGLPNFRTFLSSDGVADLVEVVGKSGEDMLLARRMSETCRTEPEQAQDNSITDKERIEQYTEVLRSKQVPMLPYQDRRILVERLTAELRQAGQDGMATLAMNSKMQAIADDCGITAPVKALDKLVQTMKLALCFSPDTQPKYETDLTVPLFLTVKGAEEANQKIESMYVGALLGANIEPDPGCVALWLYQSNGGDEIKRANKRIEAAKSKLQ